MRPSSGVGSKRRRLPLLVPALLAALLYAPMLGAGFTGDDITVQVWQVPAFEDIGDAFAPPGGITGWSGAYYRPTVFLFYMAEDRLSTALSGRAAPPLGSTDRLAPSRAVVPHAVNLLSHALCTLLVTLIALRLLRDRPKPEFGAMAAGFVFALHPMQTLVVCPVTGHSDTLATLFLLLALFLAIRARDSRNPLALIGAPIAFLLALLAKEVALAGIFLLPLFLWITDDREPRGRADPYGKIGQSLFWVPALFVYLASRTLSGVESRTAFLALPTGLDDLRALFRALAFCLRNAVLPWPVRIYTPEPEGWAVTATAAVLAAVCCVHAIGAARRGKPFLLFCLALFALACAPSLPVAWAPVAETPVAARYLYLPLVAAALLAGRAFSGEPPSFLPRFALPSLLLLLLLAGGAAVLGRVHAWRNGVALWTDALSDAETARHARPWIHLGHAQKAAGEEGKAEESYRTALSPRMVSAPEDRALAYNNLGVLALDRARERVAGNDLAGASDEMKAAESRFASAVASSGTEWLYRMNLGAAMTKEADLALALTGKQRPDLLRAARENLRAALEMNPDNPAILSALAEWESVSGAAAR